MRIFTAIILFIFFPSIVKADYGYMGLSTLICNADYGATGTIVHLDKNYFYLEVENYILNRLEFDTLKILRFEDWNCGRRYDEYTIGQKELVFFRKSNYVIDDYELLGYGGGCEFELPIRKDTIYYHSSFNGLKPYYLNDFLIAISDFNTVKQKTKETSRAISKEELKLFASKSALHKLLIECKPYKDEHKFDIPKNGYIANLESNVLYEDYENKLFIANWDIDKIILSVDSAEVWKQDKYFIVKPKKDWSRRWVSVYAKNDTQKTKVLLNQVFEIIELPIPKIHFSGYSGDTIYRYHEAFPRVAHYLDDSHFNDFLDYKLLSYTYEIKSSGKIDVYKIKSEIGNAEFSERLRKLKPNDQITVKDAYVLFPNNSVRKVSDRTVYFGKQK